ncbi:MAG: hypothetical protein M1834_005375 [Cirrosporium novae-zelandiae]|nr:MAG: hypothetical protein M1834_005375 [Cirrosporium novae-zelandiae]
MAQESPEILIVGGGIFGTSTAYHLSLTHPDPSKITVLDRAPFPSPKAASTDINKIIRADYGVRFYMDLAFEAIDAWVSMPILKDANVYHRTGWVYFDEEGSDLTDRIRKNFRESEREDETKDMTFEEAKKAWGGILSELDLSGFAKAYWNPMAGWADAATAVEILMKEAVSRGVKYEVGEVDKLVLNETGVQGVQTTDGHCYTASKVLLATGAWTSFLMSKTEDELSMPEKDRTEKQMTAAAVCCAHYKLTPEEMEYLHQMPVVIYGGKEILLPPTQSNWLKFTDTTSVTNTITLPSSGLKISVPPPGDQTTTVPKRLQAETLEIVRKLMPYYVRHNRKVEFYRLCWDSISPTQHQLITRHPHPRLQNLYLAAAGSFHSWKFLPIIGKYVVNVLNDQSNGLEKDTAWAWKDAEGASGGRGAHEKVYPQRELSVFEGSEGN